MTKEALFQLIRNEDLILWVGAGMSMYAGYPSGYRLRDAIYQGLPANRQAQISSQESLQRMAQFFVSVNGGDRTALNSLLVSIFSASPSSVDVHQRLAMIPHIRTIITTNYDRLFEVAYGDRVNVVYKSAQLTSMERDCVTVFKAHGDLDDPNSLIITESDYTRFFQDDYQNTSFWTTIRERLINNSVLFIGYGLEDINTNTIFGRISSELAESRKPHFFVAPGLIDVRVADLKRLGIDYIDSTADEIIEEILRDLKENVLMKHFSEGQGSASTVSKFVDQFGIGTTREIERGRDRLVNVFPKTNVSGTLAISAIKETVAEKRLRDFFQSKNIGPVIVSDNEYANVTLHFSEIRLPSQGLELEFSASPIFDKIVLVRFKDGFEYPGISVKAFRTDDYIEIHAEFAVARLNFKLYYKSSTASGVKSDLRFKHNKVCGSVADEVTFFKFLNKLVSGRRFDVFLGNKVIRSASHNAIGPQIREFAFYQTFFETLRKVELRVHTVFSDVPFSDVHDDTHLLISYVLAVKQNRQLTHSWNRCYEFSIDVAERIEAMKLLDGSALESGVKLFGNFEERVSIFGHDFTLGYPIYQILAPKLTRNFNGNREEMVMLISDSKQRIVHFTPTFSGPSETPAGQISIAVQSLNQTH